MTLPSPSGRRCPEGADEGLRGLARRTGPSSDLAGARPPSSKGRRKNKLDDESLAFARKLRRNMSGEERQLWSHLRNRQFNGLKFRRQVPVGGYVADFLCESVKLIIEVDGQQHGDMEDYDAARTSHLESLGYKVVRYDTAELHQLPRMLDHLAQIMEPES